MKKQVYWLALTTVLGLSAAFATPQTTAPGTSQNETTPAAKSHLAGRRADPNQQIQRLTKHLRLTADQQSQILPILSERRQQLTSLRSDSSLSPSDRHAKVKEVLQSSSDRIKAVLTDGQRQKYEEMQARMREHRHQPKSSSTGAGPTA